MNTSTRLRDAVVRVHGSQDPRVVPPTSPPNATILGLVPPRADTETNTTILGVVSGNEIDVAVRRVRAQASRSRQVEPAANAPSGRWKAFDAIGLSAKPASSKAAKLVVSTYRMIGFAILTLIVVVLLGYIATTTFYFFSRSWISPVAVSASDERVVALKSELAAQLNKRQTIVDELDQAERAIAAEQSFQLEFARAIQHDLDGRNAALGRVRTLARTAAVARAEIRKTNTAYASSSKRRLADELAAGLIDRHDMLAGNLQLAQISSSNLSIAERQAEFEGRAAELASETKALDAILGDKVTSAALSYDVLKIKHDYETSKLELAKEVQSRNSLKASLVRQDQIVDAVKQSAYLRAIADHATVAFVPYANLDGVKHGVALYACRVGMVVCHQVGTVVEVLPGEVTFKHPRRDKMVRGQMVELKLAEGEDSAAEDDVLFVGARPLFL